MPYTATQIRDRISTSKEWLQRSILAIYKSTGFRDTDKEYLDYVAQWIEAGKPLSGKHIRRARALMMKYAGQLAELANAQEEV